MNIEEATERRLAELERDMRVSSRWRDASKQHPDDPWKRAATFVASLPLDDLALLLAGRPIEERAQAAGMERFRTQRINDEGYGPPPDLWVAIPEEET